MIGIAERLADSTASGRELQKQFACRMRVACPGIIQAFDPIEQTVTVSLALRENVEVLQGLNGVTPVFTRQDVEVKQLLHVPIVLPRAGLFSVTMPIQQGDECLIVWGDMCIDDWWQNGGIANQIERRRHHLSDAFAIVGCWSQPRVLSSYSTDTMQLRTEDGTVVVELTSDTINLTAPTVNINAGQVNVNGSSGIDIEGSGNTVIEHKNFLGHQHTSVQTGSSDTGDVA